MKRLIALCVLICALSLPVLGAPNGGKRRGNPRHLPRMEFSIPSYSLFIKVLVWWL